MDSGAEGITEDDELAAIRAQAKRVRRHALWTAAAATGLTLLLP